MKPRRLLGTGFFGADLSPRAGGNLSTRFVVPPFSVLDARSGYWQERKRAWLALGIQSELGRGGEGDKDSRAIKDHEWQEKTLGKVQARVQLNRAAPSGRDRAVETASLKGGLTYGTTISPYAADAAYSKSQEKRRGILERNGKRVGMGMAGLPDDSSGGFAQNLLRSRRVGKEQKGRKPDAATFGSGRPGDLAATFERPEGLLGISTQARTYAGGYEDETGAISSASGTSIFDPVLCECFYRWFVPAGGYVIDPFAGGSVRGIVASYLGRHYTGIDLSARQIAANYVQGKRIVPENLPEWLTGNSLDVLPALEGGFNAAFSCPPYADLECYSNDPRDLSTMDYAGFRVALAAIVQKTANLLAPNSFAGFVVGEVRGPDGNFYGFVPDTIRAFEDAGLRFYNEFCLLTSVGSLPIRVGKQFVVSRKAGKTHQQLLVFIKGDARKAALACGGGVIV